MAQFILDASVILAVLRRERGGELAAEYALDAMMCSVNLAEVVTKCMERDVPPEAAVSFILGRNITVVDFDFELAVTAGRLQGAVPKGVLSLGDRACLALAMREKTTAVTADRAWSGLDLPCPVELIR